MKSEMRTAGKKAARPDHPWVNEFPGIITVCDANGTIIDLNDASVRQFAEEGGAKLIGSCIFDCHPEPARSKFKELMKSRRQNIYTIQKDGRRKLIFQTPWYRKGEFAGFLDMTLEIPWEMPHYNRDQK
jgi:PAS domain-containing protein